MTDKKIYSIRISKKLLSEIETLAAGSGTSASALITDILQRAVEQKKNRPSGAAENAVEWIPVGAATKKTLGHRAMHAHMTIEEYLLKHTEPETTLRLQVRYQDLDALTDRMEELIRTINGICKIIPDRDDTRADQIDTMILILREILDLFTETYQHISANRNRLYEEAKHLIEKDIKRYQTAERKRKSRETHGCHPD